MCNMRQRSQKHLGLACQSPLRATLSHGVVTDVPLRRKVGRFTVVDGDKLNLRGPHLASIGAAALAVAAFVGASAFLFSDKPSKQNQEGLIYIKTYRGICGIWDSWDPKTGMPDGAGVIPCRSDLHQLK